jgi:predicted RNase H-like HicB family nuclease
MHLAMRFEQETDGRWIAEIPALPGALVYGTTKKEARNRVVALALRILADRIEHGEEIPTPFYELSFRDKPDKRLKRRLSPEYLEFVRSLPRGDVQADIDAAKGDR